MSLKFWQVSCSPHIDFLKALEIVPVFAVSHFGNEMLVRMLYKLSMLTPVLTRNVSFTACLTESILTDGVINDL